MFTINNAVIAALLTTVSLSVFAEPSYKANVPASITTPDSVQTKYIGELTDVLGIQSP